jgi:seryl-tRNA synthetase
MLDIKFIRENTDLVKKTAADKNIDVDVDKILSLDEEIRALKTKLQELSEQKNKLSDQIKSADPDNKGVMIEKSKAIGEQAKIIEADLKPKEEVFNQLMLWTPNIPADDVPIGESDEDNVVVRQAGDKPEFDFPVLDHYDLLVKNDWADFERVPKVSGSRLHTLKNGAARLEIALQMYMMDRMMDKGFTLINVPSICNRESLIGTGHFPYEEEDIYHLERDDKYLAGTCEVVLNYLHSGEILSENDLPILYTGYSPCFRREAGSAGKDVRGLIRVHQFTKLEQFVICKNDLAETQKWMGMLLQNTEEMLQELELPYQVLELCTGDMGAGKYKMFDVEVWSPSQSKYRETHSCSAFTDWQARRTNTRYRENESGEVKFVHTLNNTGIATPRIMAMFLENHQTKDGRVRLPEVLCSYMQGREYL